MFEDLDANGDGVLDMDEFKTMLSTYAVLRKANDEGSVSIAALPDKVQPALKVFDADGEHMCTCKDLAIAKGDYKGVEWRDGDEGRLAIANGEGNEARVFIGRY